MILTSFEFQFQNENTPSNLYSDHHATLSCSIKPQRVSISVKITKIPLHLFVLYILKSQITSSKYH